MSAHLDGTRFEYDFGVHDAGEIVEDRSYGFERDAEERNLAVAGDSPGITDEDLPHVFDGSTYRLATPC